MLIAGVSSMYKGSSNIFFDVSINCSNSFSDTFPLLISLDLILACSDSILVESCSDDISKEKKATVDLDPFFSMLLPGKDDGRVAVESTFLPEMIDFVIISTTHLFIKYNEEATKQTIYFLKNGKFMHEKK